MNIRPRLNSFFTSVSNLLTSNLVQYLSFGLMVTAIEDEQAGNGSSASNLGIGITGCALWLISAGLQLKTTVREEKPVCNSTNIIKKAFGHIGGVGLGNALRHGIAHRDTSDARAANLLISMYAYLAINFTNSSSALLHSDQPPPVTAPHWKKARFLAEVLIDAITALGIEPLLLSQKPWDLSTEIAFPVAIVLQLGQLCLDVQHDSVNSTNPIMVKARTLNLSAFLILVPAIDIFINNLRNEYSEFNLGFQLFSGLALFGLGLGLREAVLNQPTRANLNIQERDDAAFHALPPAEEHDAAPHDDNPDGDGLDFANDTSSLNDPLITVSQEPIRLGL